MEEDEKNVLNVTTKLLVELLCSFVEKNFNCWGGGGENKKSEQLALLV